VWYVCVRGGGMGRFGDFENLVGDGWSVYLWCVVKGVWRGEGWRRWYGGVAGWCVSARAGMGV